MVKSVLIGSSVLLTVLIATLWQPLSHRATVVGLLRSQAKYPNIHGEGPLIRIPNTVHCEDLHYHKESHKLYTACEGTVETRQHWFPPLGHLNRDHAKQGKLMIIDPDGKQATELKLLDFEGPLVTHGIDILPDENGSSVRIFVINHLPNSDYKKTGAGSASLHPARSQIEIFSHVVGTDTAAWIRSVRHDSIRTPNDIYATGHCSFYVTNDHFYREGPMRLLEDVLEYNTAAWSDVVHIDFTPDATEATSGVTATTAIPKIHNPNGMGHAVHPDEVLVVDASGGELHVMSRNLTVNSSKDLTLRSRIQLDTTIDNPSYYNDIYATLPNNASGYVLAGLPFGLALADAVTTNEAPIPSIVWQVHVDEYGIQQKRVIFQDDGNMLRSASAAVLIGIDPAENDGKKQAWLFVTGFVSEAVVATKVDLPPFRKMAIINGREVELMINWKPESVDWKREGGGVGV